MPIQVLREGASASISRFVFPGGEVQVNVKLPSSSKGEVYIHAIIKNSDDIMELLLVTDAIRRQVEIGTHIRLEMPYVPYARQDRVMNPGESLSIKVFCDLINSQNYASVTIHDPHSDVTPALLNNVKVLSQAEIFARQFPFQANGEIVNWLDAENRKLVEDMIANTVLVSPDAGANKKIGEIAKVTGIEHVVRADKVRDTKTNKILETVVYSDHIGDKNFLIVDDICDGGRTFIELAKVLRPLTNGKIILYVTHGIFSYNLGVFKGIIDEIYCSHSFGQYPDNVNLAGVLPDNGHFKS